VRTADAVVVGAGVMGSATARSLARSGVDVVLLERFALGNARGSSHGRSRIFRFSYPDRRYVRMAMEALPLWREVEEDAGEELLRTTGGLDFGPAMQDHAEALGAEGARLELLDEADVATRFPFLRPPEGPALFQPDAGFVRADRAVAAFVKTAASAGAEVVPERPAVSLRAEGRHAVVETEEETYRASVAVVTAGGWARALLGPAGIHLPVRPTRETVGYFVLDESLPVPALVEWNEPAGYALRSPGQGIKAGEHGTGPQTDPNDEGTPDPASLERLGRWVRSRFPDADPEPHLAETCIYTNTDDESFVLERYGPIVVGSACSGHGFKFAPWIGRRLAGLATGEPAA
jgi:sarcosine oxidase